MFSSKKAPFVYSSWLLLVLSVIYFASHLAGLVSLPIFADEAIYVRWAQLIIDDPVRYLFFSLNDGKPPLFIWLLVPFQYLVSDQLLAARLVSVLVGWVQLLVFWLIMEGLQFKTFTKVIGVLALTLLPFWQFHHRLALMDGLLTLLISIMLLGALLLITDHQKKGIFSHLKALFNLKEKSRTKALQPLFLIAFGLAGALWTKLPALLAVPGILAIFLFQKDLSVSRLKPQLFPVFAGIGLGTVGFLLLAISKSFNQLFTRGGDFLYPFAEVLFENKWRDTLINFPAYSSYFYTYLTPALLIFIILGLFLAHQKRWSHAFFWAGALFLIPIGLFGKVVYPRYLFPAALFFTLAALAGIDSSLEHWTALGKSAAKKDFKYLAAGTIVIVVLLANAFSQSLSFTAQLAFKPDQTPLVSSDRQQYLTEWSSGHGIKETVDLIRSASQEETVAVATEGYFGTLPDGLLVYLHRTNVDNIYVEGVGQPVGHIPDSFIERAQSFDNIWLVVNANRMRLSLSQDKLIREFCRPFSAPCLQVWDISSIVKQD